MVFHIRLQDGNTALMKAYESGNIGCGTVLLDKGAQVTLQDKVSVVIIHCVHAMRHTPRVHSSCMVVSGDGH